MGSAVSQLFFLGEWLRHCITCQVYILLNKESKQYEAWLSREKKVTSFFLKILTGLYIYVCVCVCVITHLERNMHLKSCWVKRHTHTYIHIYIYMCVCVCVCVCVLFSPVKPESGMILSGQKIIQL